MIEDAIVALLLGNDAVTALIAQELYPVDLPESGDPSQPVATYQVVSDLPDYTLADGVNSQKARVQITAWAQDGATAKQLYRAIRAVLDEYSGAIGGVEISNVWIPTGPLSNFEPGLRRHRVQTDYMLLYATAE